MFPKSDSAHRALGKKGWSGFYKRYGDSFVPLSTADIRDLFLRNLSPDLELLVIREVTGALRLSLYNRGRGVAKFPSIQFSLSPHVDGQWWDAEGRIDFKMGYLEVGRKGTYPFQFMANAGIVVHPDQEFCILVGPRQLTPPKTRITRVDYRLFAENMVPNESFVEL